MSEPGFASLGPSLLARKGGAKPAMRPQVAPLVAEDAEGTVPAEDQLEDLGWNDMGHDDPADSHLATGAQIVPISDDMTTGPMTAGPGPIVRRQQRRLEERLLADAAMTGPDDRDPEYDEDDEAAYGDALAAFGSDADDKLAGEDDADGGEEAFAPLAPQPRAAAPLPRVPAMRGPRRAAFTLRLDADRHLKLRLAATMQGVSAQALVTEALDRLLAEYGELDAIANHLKRH